MLVGALKIFTSGVYNGIPLRGEMGQPSPDGAVWEAFFSFVCLPNSTLFKKPRELRSLFGRMPPPDGSPAGRGLCSNLAEPTFAPLSLLGALEKC